MKDNVKITLVQFEDTCSAESVLDRMPTYFEQASDYGSDLIAFPEYMLGRRITLEAETVQRFFELARQHQMYAVGGLIESMDERWATVALVVDRNGQLLGRYLKVHPACGPAPFYWPMAQSYACVVGGNISNGHNTGFAEPLYGQYLSADGEREEGRLFPRLSTKGDGCVHATIDLKAVRRLRKHHRMLHQRRPELYGSLCRDVTMWKEYPDVPWEHDDCSELVNRAQL